MFEIGIDVGHTKATVPLISHDPLNRLSLLVCDGCGGVLAHDGSSTEKAHRESTPDDLAPHFDARSTLMDIARRGGWTADAEDSRWSCARCSVPPARA
jgi:hypothetical protein